MPDKNVDSFVRWRDTSIPFSNNDRMKRQQVFISEFLQKFKREITNNAEETWKQIESMSPYIETSITKSQYLNLVERIITFAFVSVLAVIGIALYHNANTPFHYPPYGR